MQYGCIGAHLSHSFSKEIHGLLQDYIYELKELSMGELDAFMTRRDFCAINVTIPYKQDVMPYLEQVEETAAKIGAVNTIVNRQGKLCGYNTDFGGMRDLIKRTGIDLKNKKVLILGTGGTSKTAMAVAQNMGAASVWKVSRTAKPGVLTKEQVLENHLDAQVLINTTPVGMFASESGMAIDPGLFSNLCGVIDAVYNPLRTEFVLKARSMGVPAAGGLYMLVRQAVLASEIFLDTKYPDVITEQIYRKIKAQKENIVLTGMPGCGKTTVGKLLAQRLERPFVDLDALIEKQTGMTPGQIIVQQGEEAFRDMESAVICQVAAQTGCVIATGGGAVLRPENVDRLRRNGKLYFLDRPVEQLLPTAERPLTSNKALLLQRYEKRYPIYTATADVIIRNDETDERAAEQVERNFLK